MLLHNFKNHIVRIGNTTFAEVHNQVHTHKNPTSQYASFMNYVRMTLTNLYFDKNKHYKLQNISDIVPLLDCC